MQLCKSVRKQNTKRLNHDAHKSAPAYPIPSKIISQYLFNCFIFAKNEQQQQKRRRKRENKIKTSIRSVDCGSLFTANSRHVQMGIIINTINQIRWFVCFCDVVCFFFELAFENVQNFVYSYVHTVESRLSVSRLTNISVKSKPKVRNGK